MITHQTFFHHSLRKLKWRLDGPLARCGYRLERATDDTPSFFAQLLNERLKSSKQILFAQIGANDGIASDPLYPIVSKHPSQFSGIVVEPLPDKFERLRQAYADIPSVTPVNVAVHNVKKEMSIYRVKPELEQQLPSWAAGLGSFNPDHHKYSQLPASYITAETVRCATFDELLTSHRLSGVELIVIDTEGYDFEILRHMNLSMHRPTYVRFEHGLPNGLMTWDQYRQTVQLLTRHGYSISHEAYDTTAFLPEALEPSVNDLQPDASKALQGADAR